MDGIRYVAEALAGVVGVQASDVRRAADRGENIRPQSLAARSGACHTKCWLA